MNRFKLCIALVSAFWCPQVPAGEEKGDWSVVLGVYSADGDYGRQSDTQLRYVPLVLKYKEGPWRWSVSASWVSIDGPGNVSSGVQRASDRGSDSGLGDVHLSAQYYFPYSRHTKGWWDVRSKIKLPTADEDKGLGTGEYDAWVSAGVLRPVKSSFVLARIGYQFRRSPERLDLDHAAFLRLGLVHRINPSSRLGGYWRGKESSVDGSEALSDLTVFWSVRTSGRYKWTCLASFGLSDAAAEHMLGAQVTIDI